MRVRSAYASSLADILTFGGVDSLGGVVLPVKRFVMRWRIDLELNEGSFLALGSRSVVEALPTLWDELGKNFGQPEEIV